MKASSSTFPSRDGTQLYGYTFDPGNARGVALIVHGFGDHAGRYAEVAKTLTGLGFAAFAADYRGHGKAGGTRGHCMHYSEYLDDFDAALEQARKLVSKGPLILVTHSHGGLVALRALTDPARAPQVDGIVLSSPFLGLPKAVPFFKDLIARILSSLYPSLTLSTELRMEDLTHDGEMLRQSQADPLRHTRGSVRCYTEIQQAQAYVNEHMQQLAIPSLWLLSEPDPIVSAPMSRRAFELAGGDKKLVVYPGFFHEIFHEVERAKVLGELASWMATR